MESIKPIVQRYVDAWKKGNESEILDVLAEDCIIVESHGPTYRGKKIVKNRRVSASGPNGFIP